MNLAIFYRNAMASARTNEQKVSIFICAAQAKGISDKHCRWLMAML